MYILLDENLRLITQIPHGAPIRQGSDAEIHVCFSFDDKTKENLTIVIKNKDGAIAATPMGGGSSSQFVFKKEYADEVAFEFEPGKRYYRYSFAVDGGEFSSFGRFSWTIAITYGGSTSYVPFSFNVQRTFGNDAIDNDATELSNFNELLKRISDASSVWKFSLSKANGFSFEEDNWPSVYSKRDGAAIISGAFKMTFPLGSVTSYLTVGTVPSDVFSVLGKSTFIGRCSNGNDVELLLDGNTLKMHKMSAVGVSTAGGTQDIVYFSGACRGSIIVEGLSGYEVIDGSTIESKLIKTITGKDGVTVSVSPNGNDCVDVSIGLSKDLDDYYNKDEIDEKFVDVDNNYAKNSAPLIKRGIDILTSSDEVSSINFLRKTHSIKTVASINVDDDETRVYSRDSLYLNSDSQVTISVIGDDVPTMTVNEDKVSIEGDAYVIGNMMINGNKVMVENLVPNWTNIERGIVSEE